MYATIEISLKERLNTARASDSRKKKNTSIQCCWFYALLQSFIWKQFNLKIDPVTSDNLSHESITSVNAY